MYGCITSGMYSDKMYTNKANERTIYENTNGIHIYHQPLFYVSSAKCILWVTLIDVCIPETEVHIPVVFRRGFPNVPDNNEFPQMHFK